MDRGFAAFKHEMFACIFCFSSHDSWRTRVAGGLPLCALKLDKGAAGVNI